MLMLFLLFSLNAYAFPEMVRHHYVNCNSCHVSPSGGGLLNMYGRGMASEILSTWGSEREAMFLHGLPNPEKWPEQVLLGGDFRAVQVHREDRKLKEGRFVVMQTSFEGALTLGPITLAGTMGKVDRQRQFHPDFTRFYLMGTFFDSLQVRAGRFIPSFGIQSSNHLLPTRSQLGFGYESERDTAEAHWSGESWHGALGASRSKVESSLKEKENAFHAQLETFLADKFRIGMSLWRGESEKQKRGMASLHGILGFTERLYALTEFTWQTKRMKSLNADRETGLYHFGRVGYEITKGLHLLAIEDLSKQDLSNANSLALSAGAGVLWYPRPHFEIELTFSKRKNLQKSKEFEDYAYLLLHYYL